MVVVIVVLFVCCCCCGGGGDGPPVRPAAWAVVVVTARQDVTLARRKWDLAGAAGALSVGAVDEQAVVEEAMSVCESSVRPPDEAEEPDLRVMRFQRSLIAIMSGILRGRGGGRGGCLFLNFCF